MSAGFSVTAKRDGSRAVYGEHDDRDRYPSDRSDRSDRYGGSDGGGGGGRGGGRRDRYNNRRGNRGGVYKRGRGLNPRSRPGDNDDVDMSEGGSSKQRYNPYGKRQQPYGRRQPGGSGKMAMDRERDTSRNRGGNGPRGRGSNRGNRKNATSTIYELGRSQCNWWRVNIPFGHKLERNELYKIINENLNEPFIPHAYAVSTKSPPYAEFHVNDYDMAKSLKNLSHKVTLPTGYKMMINVRPNNRPPNAELDETTMEKLKEAMSARYDTATRALDLSNLFNDTMLNEARLKLALNKRSVMDKVLDIIHDNIIELQALDLSDNRIFVLDHLVDITTKCPNVTKLNLKQNGLRSIAELDHISKQAILDLTLEGNPLCDKYSDETSYVSAVRQRFPKVLKLDGHELPAPVTFDVEQNTVLPPTQGSYFMKEEAQRIVCTFLEEYIKLYDSNDRQGLIQAYNDDAVFSMSTSYCKLIHSHNQQNLGGYVDSSRNLLKIGSEKRNKLLKIGRIIVVSALSDLPATEHDPNSFIVDINIAEPTLLSFTLRGVFRETEGTKGDIRSFTRTFVTVPQGAGIVIQNEQYHITPATQKQVKEAFRTPAPTPSSSPVISPGTSASTAPILAAGGDVLTQAKKIEMVQAFSTTSNMNLAYSEQCLAENGWDYDTAGRVFMDLRAKNSIPPDAFLK